MKREYKFTAETFDVNRYDHFIPFVDSLSELESLTPWEDIHEGEAYHIPNLLAYKRADFIVNEKKRNYVNGLIREDGGEWKRYSLFRAETRTKFLVKKIQFNNN